MEAKNTNIIKAQNILYELRSSLNMEMELSKSMDSLYEYMILQLLTANIKNDSSALKEVEGLAKNSVIRGSKRWNRRNRMKLG